MRLVLLAGALAVLTTSCGGDDASSSPNDGGTDATATDAGAMLDAPAAVDSAAQPTVALSDVTVYAGAPATLSATAGGGASFAWALVSAPATSGVSSIPGTSAMTAFTTDAVGDYVVKVTATTAGGSASATATVHAVAAPVFFARSQFGASGGEVSVNVVGHDGSNARAVACAITFDSSQADTYRFRTLAAAAGAMDAWEAPAGQPSRFVFSGTATLTKDDAGASPYFLVAGTPNNSCNTSPLTLRSAQAPDGTFSQPRFSPDGSRVAFLEPSGASFGVSTIGFDGAAYRAIAPIYASPPASGDESTNIRPEWKDATHIAWVRPGASGAFAIVVASDAANAAVSTYVTCSSTVTPHHFEFLADGSVVVPLKPSANAPTDLFVMKPDANKACQTVRNLTALTGSSARAHDFEVSPDGKTVAFLRSLDIDGGSPPANEGELFVAAIDGSSAPTAVGSPAMVGRIGPRWIASGARLAFTRKGTPADGGDASYAEDIVVVSANGAAAKTLASGDAVSTVVGAVGPGGSCSVGRGRARWSASLLALALAAIALRRRRA